MKRLISLECNMCGKHIGSLHCHDGVIFGDDIARVKTIEKEGWDAFFMEILCDDCLEKAEKEGVVKV